MVDELNENNYFKHFINATSTILLFLCFYCPFYLKVFFKVLNEITNGGFFITIKKTQSGHTRCFNTASPRSYRFVL